jgi:ribosomal protein L37E
MTAPDEEAAEISMVCSRCGGKISWDHAGDCPHCGQSTTIMGFELADDREAAESELLAEIEFIRTTPPTCLKEFVSERRSISNSPYDATVEWGIACKCGCKTGAVTGYTRDIDDNFLLSPLSFQCDGCNLENVFFDQSLHGYNRAFDNPSESPCKPMPPQGTKTMFQCPDCGQKSFDVSLTFYNPSGSGVDLEEDPEYADRCQDFFDNFVCTTKCCQCGRSSVCTEIECA